MVTATVVHQGFLGDQLIALLRSDWTVGEMTASGGSVIAVELDDLLEDVARGNRLPNITSQQLLEKVDPEHDEKNQSESRRPSTDGGEPVGVGQHP